MAAIIGVIGVFAVFRLQIQYTVVRDSFEKLREVLLTKDPRGNQISVSGMTFEEILKHKVDFHNYLAHERSGYQKKVDQEQAYIDKALSNPSMTVIFHNQDKESYLKRISEIDSIMGRLALLTRECVHGNTEKQIIVGRAYTLTCDLGIIFILSILGLLEVNYTTTNSNLGNIVAICLTILLIFIAIRGMSFFKLCLGGGFMDDAFKMVERPKGSFKLNK